MPTEDPQYWDAVARLYDGLYDDDWSRLENRVVRSMVRAAVLAAGGRVLDIGCGTGFGYELTRDLGPDVEYTGVDISPNMLAKAQSRFPEARFLPSSSLGSQEEPVGAFDVVLMLNGVLSFVVDIEGTLAQASRSLRPDGRIVASALSKFSLRRLLRWRLTSDERFATRGAAKLPARTTARGITLRELRDALHSVGFVSVGLQGVGVFAGVLQEPALWRVDRCLCQVLPGQAHLIWGTGIRR